MSIYYRLCIFLIFLCRIPGKRPGLRPQWAWPPGRAAPPGPPTGPCAPGGSLPRRPAPSRKASGQSGPTHCALNRARVSSELELPAQAGSLPSAFTELPRSPRGGRPHWGCRLWRCPGGRSHDSRGDGGPGKWAPTLRLVRCPGGSTRPASEGQGFAATRRCCAERAASSVWSPGTSVRPLAPALVLAREAWWAWGGGRPERPEGKRGKGGAGSGCSVSAPLPDCGESGWKLLPRRAGPLFSRVPLRSFLPELKYRGEGTGQGTGAGNGEHPKVIVN